MHKMNNYATKNILYAFVNSVFPSFYTIIKSVLMEFCTKIMKNKKFFKKG